MSGDLDEETVARLRQLGVTGGPEYWRRVQRLAGAYAVVSVSLLVLSVAVSLDTLGWLGALLQATFVLSALVGVGAWIGAGQLGGSA